MYRTEYIVIQQFTSLLEGSLSFLQDAETILQASCSITSSISPNGYSDKLLAVTCSNAGFVRQEISGHQAIGYLRTRNSPELIRLHEDAMASSNRRLPTRQGNRNPTGSFLSGERRIASRRIITLTLNMKTRDNITHTVAATTTTTTTTAARRRGSLLNPPLPHTRPQDPQD